MKLSTGGLAGLAGKTLTSTMLAALLLTTALIFNENELIDNPICNIGENQLIENCSAEVCGDKQMQEQNKKDSVQKYWSSQSDLKLGCRKGGAGDARALLIFLKGVQSNPNIYRMSPEHPI